MVYYARIFLIIITNKKKKIDKNDQVSQNDKDYQIRHIIYLRMFNVHVDLHYFDYLDF